MRRERQIFRGHCRGEFGIPASEGVAGLGRICGGDDGRAVSLRDGGNIRTAVRIECNGVLVGIPHGVECQRRIFGIEIAEIIVLFAVVRFGPAGLRAAGAGKRLTAQCKVFAIELDVRHRVAGAACARQIGHIPCVGDAHIGLAGEQRKHIVPILRKRMIQCLKPLNDFREIGYASAELCLMCLMRIKHEGYMLANRHRLFQ